MEWQGGPREQGHGLVRAESGAVLAGAGVEKDMTQPPQRAAQEAKSRHGHSQEPLQGLF